MVSSTPTENSVELYKVLEPDECWREGETERQRDRERERINEDEAAANTYQ